MVGIYYSNQLAIDLAVGLTWLYMGILFAAMLASEYLMILVGEAPIGAKQEFTQDFNELSVSVANIHTKINKQTLFYVAYSAGIAFAILYSGNVVTGAFYIALRIAHPLHNSHFHSWIARQRNEAIAS